MHRNTLEGKVIGKSPKSILPLADSFPVEGKVPLEPAAPALTLTVKNDGPEVAK
jgi:hypothetical protein